jgi:uncharacterized protein YuzB (UPF0349 family)
LSRNDHCGCCRTDNFNVNDEEYVEEDDEEEGFFQGSQVTLLDLAHDLGRA